MLEYKVIHPKVKELEDAINEAARDGWRVVSVITDFVTLSGSFKGTLIVTLEREKNGTAL
ncbi:MAG: DUF4177 domain-containing protein [Clostridia bacterium]|nr:DUF4177 domain-containing protein [Clostridia bacterium]